MTRLIMLTLWGNKGVHRSFHPGSGGVTLTPLILTQLHHRVLTLIPGVLQTNARPVALLGSTRYQILVVSQLVVKEHI